MPTMLPVQLPGLSGLVGGNPLPPAISGTAATPGQLASGGALSGPGQLIDSGSVANATGANGFQSVHTPMGATGTGQVSGPAGGMATLRVPGAAIFTPEPALLAAFGPVGAMTPALGLAQVSSAQPFSVPLFL